MLRIISIILILIGAFAVWSSYKAGTLHHDTVAVIDDTRKVVIFFIKDKADETMVNHWFEECECFISGITIPTFEKREGRT